MIDVNKLRQCLPESDVREIEALMGNKVVDVPHGDPLPEFRDGDLIECSDGDTCVFFNGRVIDGEFADWGLEEITVRKVTRAGKCLWECKDTISADEYRRMARLARHWRIHPEEFHEYIYGNYEVKHD